MAKETKTKEWNGFANLKDAYEQLAIINFPSKSEWRERIMFMLDTWSLEPDAYELQQFLNMIKFPARRFYELVSETSEYPELREIYTEVKLRLASRKRIGALKKEFEPKVAFYDMHRLDPSWKEIDKYHADLKKEEDRSTGTILVEIPTTRRLRDKDEEEHKQADGEDPQATNGK